MKRTLSVTLVVGGLLFAIFTGRLCRQQHLLDSQDARAADERAQAAANTPPPVSEPGEPGGAGAASLPLSQLLKKLYPNMPLEVLPVGEAVLLRGDVWSDEIHRQVVEIAEQFYPKVLAQLRVQPPKIPRADPAKAETAKPILIGDDRRGLREMLGKLYPTATLEVNFLNDAVLIRGRVARAQDIKPITEIAEQFAPKVLNYLTSDDRQPTAPPMAGMMGSSAAIGLGGPSRLPVTKATPRDDQDTALDREAKQLAARVRVAQEPENSKLRGELEKLTEKHFEHRQQRRAAEIAELADRVEKLRVAQHRRQESKADIVKRRVADLLHEDNDLRWDSSRFQLPDGIYWFRAPSDRSPVDHRMEPIVKRLENEGHRIEVIDVERSSRLVERWKIDAYPTFLIVHAGKELARLRAYQTYEALKRLAQRASPEPAPHPIDGDPMPVFSEVATPKRGDAEWIRSTEDAKNVATAALVRAAEARRKFAALLLTKADESNKKVPGAIPTLDIERLKANLEIADAEVDAAKAGVDISRTDKSIHDNNAEPTYKGVSLSEWLRRLENERNPDKLVEAVVAMNSLAGDAEPSQLVRATLRMMQAYVPRQSDITHMTIFYGSVGLLCLAKSDVVVEDLIAELNAAPTTKLSLQFRFVWAELFRSLVQQPDGLLFASNLPVPRVSKDAVQSLRIGLRRNSSRFVTALVAAAQRDPALSDWLVGCTPDLLSLGEQPLMAHSDLLQLVERVFADAKSDHQHTAARLLGSNNVRVPEVLALAESWLSSNEGRSLPSTDGGFRSASAVEAASDLLAAIGPHSPQAVTRLTETLRDRWTQFAEFSGKPVTKSPKSQRDDSNCVILIVALGRIGETAREAISLLREIEQSPASEAELPDMIRVVISGSSRSLERTPKTLRALATATIQQIENVKPKPNTDSRTDEN